MPLPDLSQLRGRPKLQVCLNSIRSCLSCATSRAERTGNTFFAGETDLHRAGSQSHLSQAQRRNLGNLHHPDSLADRHRPRHCTVKEKQGVNHGMISSYSLPLGTAKLKVSIPACHKAPQFSCHFYQDEL